eukprot:CAMPEP_0118882156 /NCGR_PEP_ID=MMETSP1163-20130328/21444_1 /TAXON_ID=124430 /ORGANISM="Phaeomonas parva, Strain CCMP2877" /LENGTH=54 /DNA_ID=CAMNT_0006819131 /DNA_START=431 /DNA_END=591 /DNA_ORIENTATION=-
MIGADALGLVTPTQTTWEANPPAHAPGVRSDANGFRERGVDAPDPGAEPDADDA